MNPAYGLAILVLLALLVCWWLFLIVFQSPGSMGYTVHTKRHSRPAILAFLTFLALLVVVF